MHKLYAADGGAPAGGTEKPDAGESPVSRSFSQEELDQIVKERLARQQRAHEQQAREAKEAAEAKQLEDQEEWKTLANNRAEELKKLKPRAQAAEGYEKGVAHLMAKATEELPANIQTILNKLTLSDQLEWLAENLDSVKHPAQTTPGMNTNAWARGGGSPQQMNDAEFLEKKRREMLHQ